MFDLNDQQRKLLRGSWARVAMDPDFTAQLFYGRLFTQRPDLRAMFGTDIKVQGRKLMDTLNYVIDHLDQPETLAAPVRDLGVRHKGYGAVMADYDDVGAALIWSLQNVLGDNFKQDAEVAWATAYGQIASAMTDATA